MEIFKFLIGHQVTSFGFYFRIENQNSVNNAPLWTHHILIECVPPFGCFSIEQQSPSLLYLILDRKSTRLNSSHVKISYAVFCLKKKKYRNGRVIDSIGCVV